MSVSRVQEGATYDGWFVLGKDESRKYHYRCRCRCGNERSIYSSNLLGGRSRQCGTCSRLRTPSTVLDLNGQTFGRWLVLHRDEGRTGGNSYFVCRCSCGRQASVHSGNLLSGKSTKCRTCGDETAVVTKRSKAKPASLDNVPNAYWQQVLRSAKARDHAVLLSSKEAWSLYVGQNGKCALSGVEIGFRGWRSRGTASLDRISSDGDYTVNNVQWLHKDVNRMKDTLPQDVFIQWCITIARHYGEHTK